MIKAIILSVIILMHAARTLFNLCFCNCTACCIAYSNNIVSYLMSGDPRQDLEYERQYVSHGYIVPEVIKNFLLYFQKYINQQDLLEIQNSYENG